ncbi:hypothetical protein BX666DRAFT_2025268 [Dichotomocladium elegans]|nr:hypothetical protein BX666DRAFT_2025268 [Dichotomocladium elegans]
MYIPEGRAQSEAPRIREFVNHHKNEDLWISEYERPVFPYSQQWPSYEGTKIYTDYMNNAHMRFGQQLRRVINVVLNLRQQKADGKGDLVAQGLSSDQVCQDLYETITCHSTVFKLAIARRTL